MGQQLRLWGFANENISIGTFFGEIQEGSCLGGSPAVSGSLSEGETELLSVLQNQVSP